MDTFERLQGEHGSGQGRLKLTADKNKAEDGGVQQVANGWGESATSWEVQASENENKGTGSQFVAESKEVRKSGKSGSCCSVL